MTDEVKGGQQVLNEFFSKMTEIKDVDKDTANIVIKLYKEGKLTNTNLSNAFTRISEEKLNVKN